MISTFWRMTVIDSRPGWFVVDVGAAIGSIKHVNCRARGAVGGVLPIHSHRGIGHSRHAAKGLVLLMAKNNVMTDVAY